MVATASTEHSYWLALAFVLSREIFTQQTQAPANRNARSKQWQPFLAASQRNRLRLDGNWASVL